VTDVRDVVGCFFLWASGIHVGIVAADTSFYGSFAAKALVALVERAWIDVFMAQPRLWGSPGRGW